MPVSMRSDAMRWLPLLIALAGCPNGPVPTPTGTTCTDPDPVTGTTTLTWDNFGKAFMARYCTNCHNSALTTLSSRHNAPVFHDFDTLLGVLEVIASNPNHIDEQAGWGPEAKNNFMPGAGTGGRCPSTPGGALDEACPEPSGDERTQLAQWVACERLRTHDFSDAGVSDATGDAP